MKDQDPTRTRRPEGAWLRRRLAGVSTGSLVAFGLLAIYIVVAATAPLWAPYQYSKLLAGRPLSPPSNQHLFGTDQLGRDVFSRVVTGARIVLTLSFCATFLGVVIGGTVGILSGYLGGWVDAVVMRLVDILLTIPPIIFALLVLSGFGSSSLLLVLTVSFCWAPRSCRVARGKVMELINREFVTAAELRGESAWLIARSELLPNVMSTLSVEFAVRFGFSVTMIGSLGYLGFGVRPPIPEWGVMVSENRHFISSAPWTVFYPVAAIAILCVAISLATDGLADLVQQRDRQELAK